MASEIFEWLKRGYGTLASWLTKQEQEEQVTEYYKKHSPQKIMIIL